MLVCSIFLDIETLLNSHAGTKPAPGILQRIRTAVKSRTLPDSRDLLRFCAEIQLDFFRTLALILKREWEEYFELEQTSEFDTIACHRLAYLSPSERFIPDTRKLFALFESNNQWERCTNFGKKSFDELVRRMVLSQLHLTANGSLKVEFLQSMA